MIPPPNVTGILHIGHILNNTIQDILIRKARMEGKSTLWQPGTDHASIATEAKVTKMLKDKGIDKNRIDGKGYGSERPLVNKNSIESRKINRRVEIIFKKNIN